MSWVTTGFLAVDGGHVLSFLVSFLGPPPSTYSPGLTSPELQWPLRERAQGLLRPGLDNTRLFMSLTAGAGTRCMSLLSSSPILMTHASVTGQVNSCITGCG